MVRIQVLKILETDHQLTVETLKLKLVGYISIRSDFMGTLLPISVELPADIG